MTDPSFTNPLLASSATGMTKACSSCGSEVMVYRDRCVRCEVNGVAKLAAVAAVMFLAPVAPTFANTYVHHKKPACIYRDKPTMGCLAPHRHREVRLWRIQQHKLKAIKPYREWLRSTGDCENGPYGGRSLREGLRAYNPSPFFGRYQFVLSTWASVGGTGDPRDANWLEQAYRAVILLVRAGDEQWPVCGD